MHILKNREHTIKGNLADRGLKEKDTIKSRKIVMYGIWRRVGFPKTNGVKKDIVFFVTSFFVHTFLTSMKYGQFLASLCKKKTVS